jgi:hypothetical protein
MKLLVKTVFLGKINDKTLSFLPKQASFAVASGPGRKAPFAEPIQNLTDLQATAENESRKA